MALMIYETQQQNISQSDMEDWDIWKRNIDSELKLKKI